MGKHEAPRTAKFPVNIRLPQIQPKKREAKPAKAEPELLNTEAEIDFDIPEKIEDFSETVVFEPVREVPEEVETPDESPVRRRHEAKNFDLSSVTGAVSGFFRDLSRRAPAASKKQIEREYEFSMRNVVTIAVAAVLFLLVWLIPTSGWLRFVTFLIPLALVGWETFRDASEELMSGGIIGRNVLTLLACILCLCIGEYPSAVFVMLLFRVLLMVEAYARGEAKVLSDELDDRLPKTARLKTDRYCH